MMSLARTLLLACVISVLAVVAGPLGIASAAAAVTIESPTNGSTTTDTTPTFKGMAEPGGGEVTVAISPVGGEGTTTTKPVTPSATGSWKVTSAHLADATYTAVATQEGEPIPSAQVTFTVETAQPPSHPPHVTLTYPANGSTNTTGTEPVGGLAGTLAEAGTGTVTVQLFSGPVIGVQQALEALTVPVSPEGAWSGTFGGLGVGTYTIRAEQSNSHGEVGISPSATFTVVIPAGPAPPAASFQWFPPFPSTGENVSLVSSSTDTASPITSFAWALTATAPFQTGKPVLVTSFATPGAHTVRLRVTDGNGLSSIATEAISVKSSPLILMQPFPIVRIAGSETHSGVRIRLLTAEAPPGAHITVRCKGRGCPVKAAKRIAVSSKSGAAPLTFHTFERSLRAGITLEILIYKSGQIGKYTRFVIHRGKLPQRTDMCLSPTGLTPLVCPSS
jgi:hypothetical protein